MSDERALQVRLKLRSAASVPVPKFLRKATEAQTAVRVPEAPPGCLATRSSQDISVGYNSLSRAALTGLNVLERTKHRR